MTRAGSIAANAPAIHAGEGRAALTPALHSLQVKPVPIKAAKPLVERFHYLHSVPGGSKLAFGAFIGNSLLGALILGCGPLNAFQLVEGAVSGDCLTLTRLWLSDELPKNSESKVIGFVLRALRKHTAVKFVISYADPSQGHLGGIYKATNWAYTGLSQAMPLYDIGDGKARHSRSLSHAYGTHSLEHFQSHGVTVKLVEQSPKHRYVYFLDPSWRQRLKVAPLPYPKKEVGPHGTL